MFLALLGMLLPGCSLWMGVLRPWEAWGIQTFLNTRLILCIITLQFSWNSQIFPGMKPFQQNLVSICKEEGYPGILGGHPSKHWTGSKLLNFSDPKGTCSLKVISQIETFFFIYSLKVKIQKNTSNYEFCKQNHFTILTNFNVQTTTNISLKRYYEQSYISYSY